jgi:acetyltransferase-like isoleucine patch superfamily enzyme
VVISGFCEIGDNCFFGVNVAVGNNIKIAEDCWIGPGVSISRNTNAGEIHRAPESVVAKVSAPRFFKAQG